MTQGATLPHTPSFSLESRLALVSGAGRGLGLAAAAALAGAGAEVVLTARSKQELEEATAAIASSGHRARSLVLDMTNVDAVRRAVAELPPFDVFVNNAGTNRPAAFLDVTTADFDAIMALNLRAAFFAAQAVARRMVEGGKPGSIINMSSQMGLVGGERRSVYCASKWAMEGMTKAMAVELARYGIRVNTLCPTFIETPMTRPFFADPVFRASVLTKIKLGRLGKPEDLMGAILLLAGDASAMITGSSLVVDGGWTAD